MVLPESKNRKALHPVPRDQLMSWLPACKLYMSQTHRILKPDRVRWLALWRKLRPTRAANHGDTQALDLSSLLKELPLEAIGALLFVTTRLVMDV